MNSIFGLTRNKLAQQLRGAFDEASVSNLTLGTRAEAVFAKLYPRPGRKPKQVHLKSFQSLSQSYSLELPLEIAHEEASNLDGSRKFLFRTKKGHLIETVLIQEPGRFTACLSTQVGCAQACRFCQTGRMGLLDQLEASEIVAQVLILKSILGPKEASLLSNIVLMGMGEPLDNLDNVLAAIDILSDDQGFQFSRNKITLSTVGLLGPLEKFLNLSPCSLALSLHNPFSGERDRLMPVNVLNPLSKVVALMRDLAPAYRRSYLIQYTLIRGVNDSQEHAEALATLLTGLPCKINLIPLNEHSGAAFRRPDLDSLRAFQKNLKLRGHVVTIRLSKGRDISAACGQLIAAQNERPLLTCRN